MNYRPDHVAGLVGMDAVKKISSYEKMDSSLLLAPQPNKPQLVVRLIFSTLFIYFYLLQSLYAVKTNSGMTGLISNLVGSVLPGNVGVNATNKASYLNAYAFERAMVVLSFMYIIYRVAFWSFYTILMCVISIALFGIYYIITCIDTAGQANLPFADAISKYSVGSFGPQLARMTSATTIEINRIDSVVFVGIVGFAGALFVLDIISDNRYATIRYA